MCHCLTSSDDENSSTNSSPLHNRTEQSSAIAQQMAYHLTDDSFQDVPSDEEEEEEEEEHFPTTPLDDDVWMEEPVPDRCASMNSHKHMTCTLTLAHKAWISYTKLQNMHQHHSTWTSVTFDFPDVMTTASNEAIPSLEDVFGL